MLMVQPAQTEHQETTGRLGTMVPASGRRQMDRVRITQMGKAESMEGPQIRATTAVTAAMAPMAETADRSVMTSRTATMRITSIPPKVELVAWEAMAATAGSAE